MAMIEDLLDKEAARQENYNAANVLATAAATIRSLRAIVEKHQPRLRKLQALENYGVDNWQGYDEAMEDCFGKSKEDDDE